jgi:hypothetical protein
MHVTRRSNIGKAAELVMWAMALWYCLPPDVRRQARPWLFIQVMRAAWGAARAAGSVAMKAEVAYWTAVRR